MSQSMALCWYKRGPSKLWQCQLCVVAFFALASLIRFDQKCSKDKNKKANAINWRTIFKSGSDLTKNVCLKNDEKSFLFHLKSFFRFKDI